MFIICCFSICFGFFRCLCLRLVLQHRQLIQMMCSSLCVKKTSELERQKQILLSKLKIKLHSEKKNQLNVNVEDFHLRYNLNCHNNSSIYMIASASAAPHLLIAPQMLFIAPEYLKHPLQPLFVMLI